jgi:formate hydrogenlyase subunit 6/NADH:ubiquinone oxidoreductase subunit I
VGVARYGYCEYNCTLCTKVCPTDAIHPLDVEDKKKRVIGVAYIDRSRCYPWYKGRACSVCEEHCPTSPTKAIWMINMRLINHPHVREDVCIGCGVCETKCPVEGKSAIIVTPQNEQRWVDQPS